MACALVLGVVGACTSLSPAAGSRYGPPGSTAASDPTYGTGRLGGVVIDTGLLHHPRERAGRGANAGAELAVRRQCRSASVPRGFIAVGYEGSTSECPGLGANRGDSAATVAVLVEYATAAIGTRLDVCSDQPTPFGWNPVTDESAGDPGACPGAAPRDHATVRRIRRDS